MVGDSNASDQSNMGIGEGLSQIVKVIHDIQQQNIFVLEQARGQGESRKKFLINPSFVVCCLCVV